MHYVRIFLLCPKLQLSVSSRRDLLWLAPRMSAYHWSLDLFYFSVAFTVIHTICWSISNKLCILEWQYLDDSNFCSSPLDVYNLVYYGDSMNNCHMKCSVTFIFFLIAEHYWVWSTPQPEKQGEQTTPILVSGKLPSYWSFRVLHWWECLAYYFPALTNFHF